MHKDGRAYAVGNGSCSVIQLGKGARRAGVSHVCDVQCRAQRGRASVSHSKGVCDGGTYEVWTRKHGYPPFMAWGGQRRCNVLLYAHVRVWLRSVVVPGHRPSHYISWFRTTILVVWFSKPGVLYIMLRITIFTVSNTRYIVDWTMTYRTPILEYIMDWNIIYCVPGASYITLRTVIYYGPGLLLNCVPLDFTFWKWQEWICFRIGKYKSWFESCYIIFRNQDICWFGLC